MQPIFEAKYLAIAWFDKNIVSKISESITSIKIELENTTLYNMEIQTYKRIENGFDGQIAFHIFDKETDIVPYFINANNEKINLMKIEDPQTKKNWWIEDGSWKKIKVNGEGKVYLSSDLWNHAGETKIYFNNIICNINISAISFTKKQLELYLEDFKNDFWYLILKKNSLTQVNAKNSPEEIKILNKETVIIIKNFIQHIQNILKNPKKELKEIQELKDINKVKPVVKTFMEIVTGGMKRKLTSRETIESYNVSENKYIHYILYQVSIILFNMTRASQYINNFYQSKANAEQKRVDKFTDIKIIDKEIIENNIIKLKEKIDKIKYTLTNIEKMQNISIKEECEQEVNKLTLQDLINIAIQNQNTQQLYNVNQLQTFRIKLESKQDDYKNIIQFWGKIRNIDEQEWHGNETNDKYSLEFNLDLFQFLKSREGYEFSIKAHINHVKRHNIHNIHFINIIEFKPLTIEKQAINIKYQTLYIKLEKKQDIFQNQLRFWGKVKLESDKEWFKFKKGDSISLEFDFNIFNHILLENTEYMISAHIEKSKVFKKNGGLIHKRYFKYITKIEQISNFSFENELNYYLKQKKQLERTNWSRPLNNKEKIEQEKEKEAIKKQIQILNDESQTANEYIKQLEPLIQILKNILNQFNQLSIVQDSYFPNSMTFIQNPNYQGAYKYYELIKNMVGIDESLFLSIQKIDKIGVLDIPTLYERWCFLQIIKVLIDKYHFLPEKDWKQKLLIQMIGNTNEVRKNIKNIMIKFENLILDRKIILHYEKELNGPNSKRPDYILEIESLKTNQKHNLIMDAKFKEKSNIKDLIEELYYKKNYSQKDKNTVFILHPDSKNSITKMNPSDWGNDAYYGESNMFNFQWDNDDFPNHKYGAILLSPIKDTIDYGNYLDNLQRLIGMSLQYQLEYNKKNDIILGNLEKEQDVIDPIPKEKKFCLKCGSEKIKTIYSGFSTSQKGIFYEFQCEECKHNFIYFYCWNCKHRLIKNGSYWSYHSFQPLEPFDIQCPHCAKFWHQNEGYEESKARQILKQNNTKYKITIFETCDEATKYAKENPNSILSRNDNGTNWVVKEKKI